VRNAALAPAGASADPVLAATASARGFGTSFAAAVAVGVLVAEAGADVEEAASPALPIVAAATDGIASVGAGAMPDGDYLEEASRGWRAGWSLALLV
jgi:hypothetical protein